MHPLVIRVANVATRTSKDYTFYVSPIHIGRSPDNDMVLDAPFVSHRHGVIRFDEQTIEYVDLGSSNGTTVDGRALDRHVPVRISPETDLRIISLQLICARTPAKPNAIDGDQSVPSTRLPKMSRPARPTTIVRSLPDTEPLQVLPVDGLTEVLSKLTPRAERYRIASALLLAEIRRVIASLPSDLQATAILKVAKQLPALASEAAFRELAAQHRVSLLIGGDGAEAATKLVNELAQTLVPDLVLSSPQDIERFLTHVSAALQTSMRAFVQLRQVHERFCSEMGVPVPSASTPLHEATDAGEIQAFLLDIHADVTERIRDLTSAYKEMMIHPVALLSGTMEGALNLLGMLSPATITRHVQASAFGIARMVAPIRQLWRTFAERHRELSEERRELSAALFGERFVHAYLAAFGSNSDDLATGHS